MEGPGWYERCEIGILMFYSVLAVKNEQSDGLHTHTHAHTASASVLGLFSHSQHVQAYPNKASFKEE